MTFRRLTLRDTGSGFTNNKKRALKRARKFAESHSIMLVAFEQIAPIASDLGPEWIATAFPRDSASCTIHYDHAAWHIRLLID